MSHEHTPVRASRRARLVLGAALAPVLAATVWGVVALWPSDEPPTLQTMAPGSSIVEVTVVGVDPEILDDAQVRALTADDREVRVHTPPELLAEIERGDAVRAVVLPESSGMADDSLVFLDFVRGPPLLLLAAVFTLLVVLVARLRGLAALVGLGLSLAGLAGFTLPALLSGGPALPITVVSATAMMTVLLYLAHGFSARTTAALLGTVVGIALTAGVAAWATGAAHLTGLSGEYGRDLLAYAPQTSLRGVLLCGFVLAGLGVLNDVTITQASAVWELRAAAPEVTRRDVFTRAMRIGRDHIASTVYTVSFAYVGASLPLVLLVAMSDRALLDVLTAGEVAEEVARTLVGSIGLVVTIPVTTAIAAAVAGRRSLEAVPAAQGVVEGPDAPPAEVANQSPEPLRAAAPVPTSVRVGDPVRPRSG